MPGVRVGKSSEKYNVIASLKVRDFSSAKLCVTDRLLMRMQSVTMSFFITAVYPEAEKYQVFPKIHFDTNRKTSTMLL